MARNRRVRRPVARNERSVGGRKPGIQGSSCSARCKVAGKCHRKQPCERDAMPMRRLMTTVMSRRTRALLETRDALWPEVSEAGSARKLVHNALDVASYAKAMNNFVFHSGAKERRRYQEQRRRITQDRCDNGRRRRCHVQRGLYSKRATLRGRK